MVEIIRSSSPRVSPGSPSPNPSGPLVALVLSALVALFAGCAHAPASRPDGRPAETAWERFEFSQAQMGVDFRITLHAPDAAAAEEAAGRAYQRIAELNAVLSDYDSESELSRLSRKSGSGQWATVSPDLWIILSRGVQVHRQSDGAFDLTIGPSVNLWRRARRQQQLPDPALLQTMRERVGSEHLQLDPVRHAARLDRPDMRLDAGGIAKGFAMDEALNVLRRLGVSRAMIHGGGDMVFGDPPPGADGWRIQLADPRGAVHDTSPTLVLSNCALATSGDLFQFLEIDGVRYSHIVNPKTGVGLTHQALVRVIAPDGLTADSLSTAISVMGPETGLTLLQDYPECQASISWSSGGTIKTISSTGFDSHLID